MSESSADAMSVDALIGASSGPAAAGFIDRCPPLSVAAGVPFVSVNARGGRLCRLDR